MHLDFIYFFKVKLPKSLATLKKILYNTLENYTIYRVLNALTTIYSGFLIL